MTIRVGRRYYRGHLSRKVYQIEYNDWLNDNVIYYTNQYGNDGCCTQSNFERWVKGK